MPLRSELTVEALLLRNSFQLTKDPNESQRSPEPMIFMMPMAMIVSHGNKMVRKQLIETIIFKDCFRLSWTQVPWLCGHNWATGNFCWTDAKRGIRSFLKNSKRKVFRVGQRREITIPKSLERTALPDGPPDQLGQILRIVQWSFSAQETTQHGYKNKHQFESQTAWIEP